MEPLSLTPIRIDPKTFLYEHCVLPALPKVLTRFQEAVQSEEVTINRIINIISSDPGIVAEVLKVVNSAYYSLPREVSRIDMAVAYLGIQEVHHIVMASSVVKGFDIRDAAAFKQIWRHSLYTALCARYLASRYERHLSLGEIWAPSLLHDVGMLVYLKFFPDHFKAVRQYAEEHGYLFREAVAANALPSSAYLGELLCERWRLPTKIKKVCAMEKDDVLEQLKAGREVPVLHRLVVLADVLAVIATERLRKEKQFFFSDAVMQILDLTEAEFLVLMGAITDMKLEADRLAA